jgi:adenylylsulfate kinase
MVIWFTGLSGSGKSTLANHLEQELIKRGIHVYVLDGDNIRNGINSDLTFTETDRIENIRRVAEIAKLFVDAGIVCLASFIAPTEPIRAVIHKTIDQDDLINVYLSAPLDVCENRDVKGLYQLARSGKIEHFTGINAPFERPRQVDIEIDTSSEDLKDSLERLVNFIIPRLDLK